MLLYIVWEYIYRLCCFCLLLHYKIRSIIYCINFLPKPNPPQIFSISNIVPSFTNAHVKVILDFSFFFHPTKQQITWALLPKHSASDCPLWCCRPGSSSHLLLLPLLLQHLNWSPSLLSCPTTSILHQLPSWPF
jgi:hypothetical protein